MTAAHRVHVTRIGDGPQAALWLDTRRPVT